MLEDLAMLDKNIIGLLIRCSMRIKMHLDCKYEICIRLINLIHPNLNWPFKKWKKYWWNWHILTLSFLHLRNVYFWIIKHLFNISGIWKIMLLKHQLNCFLIKTCLLLLTLDWHFKNVLIWSILILNQLKNIQVPAKNEDIQIISVLEAMIHLNP